MQPNRAEGRGVRGLVLGWLLVLCAPAPAQVILAAAGQKSLCSVTEEVVFSCRTKEKMVSVCAAKNLSPTTGYVQYRFGKPDAAALEMALPADKLPPARSATGDTLMFSGGGGAWLRFRKGDVAYVPYTAIGRWGPKMATMEKSGVLVERAGKKAANVKCVDAPTSLLGQAWFDKAGIHAGQGEEFDMPD